MVSVNEKKLRLRITNLAIQNARIAFLAWVRTGEWVFSREWSESLLSVGDRMGYMQWSVVPEDPKDDLEMPLEELQRIENNAEALYEKIHAIEWKEGMDDFQDPVVKDVLDNFQLLLKDTGWDVGLEFEQS